ncbi:MAG: bifunctional adenosylcobinamide kinase/adenosylcobinamide-phosphate guanylyltransferase [Deltaproteobacteria bacterium]|nr:bifunctional adenosylcobinamide kinase/adenosylcobinamide-phosphate guanylyltransferase [Deltaproteobacteria bacterium]
MNSRFIFVLGGARSGKSSFALRLGEELYEDSCKGKTLNEKIFLATARALDCEMEERIALHKKERGSLWRTIEEPKDILSHLQVEVNAGVFLVDCLTLWISNLMETNSDNEITDLASKTAKVCKNSSCTVIAVSNEVGLGLVPTTPLGRRFRDLSGRVNQIMASSADEVYLLTAGIAQKIK